VYQTFFQASKSGLRLCQVFFYQGGNPFMGRGGFGEQPPAWAWLKLPRHTVVMRSLACSQDDSANQSRNHWIVKGGSWKSANQAHDRAALCRR
jgi:hypothetical protein